jgi:hypothetical protein
VETARFFQFPRAKQFLRRSSSSRVIGKGTVAHSALNDDPHVAQTTALVIGKNKVALCSFARLLQVDQLPGVGDRSCGTLVLGASYDVL